MIAILYKSGIPVNLTDVATETKYDIEGFLIEFVFTDSVVSTRYRYYMKSNFKKEDRNRSDLSDGFYAEDKFLKYIQDKDAGANIGIPSSSDMIYKYKFNFDDYISNINAGDYNSNFGDSILVAATNFGFPYDLFYDRIIYEFKIQKLPDNSAIQKYAEGQLNGLNNIDYLLKLPINFSQTTLPVVNSATSPGGYFFSKNLGAYINSVNNNEEKRRLKKILIIIIFKIREIVGKASNNLNGVIDGIIPNIMNNIGFNDADLETLANSSVAINFDNYKTNPVDAIKKLIFILKKSWGYYYIPGSSLLHRSDIPIIFSPLSSYSDFEYYYLGLVSFYDTLYKEAISNIPDFLKFEMILQFLPINALSILPLSLVKDILISLIQKKKLAEDEKRFVVRMVSSVSISNADSFLDFLLESNEGLHTNYESIYYILGDARIEDYFLVNNLEEEIQTRKLYVFAIFDLWKSSKYNMYFLPNGVIPISENVNPDSYYLQNPDQFNDKNILTFISKVDVALGSNRVSFPDTSFEAKMNCDKIEITKIETKKNIYINNLLMSSLNAAFGDGNPQKEIFGTYDLFHPIYIIGYNANLQLEMSDNNYVPAFLFQYITEFDDIKDFDALVNFVFQVGVEVGLAYFTGGLSSLRHLNHLKYSYKIFQAMTSTALASEQILVFSGFEALTNIISITGSIFFSFNNYLATTENNPAMAQRRAELSNILLYIVLASAAGSMFFRYKAVSAADAFLDSIPSGSIPPDIESLLLSLRNLKASNILSIRQKIMNMGDTQEILLKFDDYAVNVKEALWTDFKNLSNAEWINLNLNNAIALDRWKELFNMNIIDRKFVNVIKSISKTEAIKKWYNYPQLKSILEPLDSVDRWIFFNKFGDEIEFFAKFTQNPIKITQFITADAYKRSVLILNKNFWLVNNFDTATVINLQIPLDAAKKTVIARSGADWFINPANKVRAEKFLNDGQAWSNGMLVEIPAQNYLMNIINSNENVLISVDMAFYDNLGNKISDTIQEIDGLLVNNETNKIENIISMKIDGSKHNFTTDNKKLTNFMRNIPDNGVAMKNYILNTVDFNKGISPKILNNAVEVKIIYTDLRTGKRVTESPSIFKMKLKTSYNPVDDFQKIHPEILNTTKAELVESSYQSIKNKF